MKNWKHYLTGIGISLAAVVVLTYLGASKTSAQPAGQPDVAMAIGQSIVTHTVTIRVENQRGEPRMVSGRTSFDKPIQAYWLSVVGVDMKFQGMTEKYINRQMFAIDPFAKVMNNKDVEVSGKLGMRDGTGDWDDTYEGTITVAVTAITGK